MSRRDFGVAIGLPEPFTSELQDWREHLGDPNAAGIPPHVTLLPPTALREAALTRVEVHLRCVAAQGQPFEMVLRGSATFRPVSPVVFVPVVKGLADCERLQARVRSGPLHRELKFPYHPHVTVAHDLPEEARYEATFAVWGFALFEQDREGVWRPQRDFPFGSGRPGPLEPAGHR